MASTPKIVAELFELAALPEMVPRFNIAPTQPAPVVLSKIEQPGRRFELLRWGLIPSWAKDPAIGARMINARAETIAGKPSFRSAFKQRRCLIVADGFYEWQKLERKKQPFYIHLRDRVPFGLAGLWECWERGGDEAIESCTIITTEPNEVVAPLHNRMPVILHRKDYDVWLDPENRRTEELASLLRPYPPDQMAAYAVSTRVNKPSTDTPECIKPLN